MPRTVNYKLGKIYKIHCVDDPTICFIGNTCQPYLCNRLQQHKLAFNSKPDSNELYKTVSSKGGWDKFRINLLESFPCSSLDELKARANELATQNNARKC